MQTFLFGTIAAAPFQVGPSSLRVLAVAADDPTKRWMAVVDDEGRFELDAGAVDPFQSLRSGDSLSLVLRVLDGPQVLLRTTTSIRVDAIAPHVTLRWPSMAVGGPGIWIGGHVRSSDGDAVPSVSITVDRIAKGECHASGRAHADDEGAWSVRISTDGSAQDIVVTATTRDGRTLASQIWRRVQTELVADLVIPAADLDLPARYEGLHAKVRRELGDRSIAGATEEDRARLVQDLSETPARIAALVEDARWADRGAPVGALFVVASEGTARPSDVLSRPSSDLEALLHAAIESRIVTAWNEPTTVVAERLRKAAADLELEGPAGSRELAWLSAAGVEPKVAVGVVRADLLGERDASWDALGREHGQDAVTAARFALDLRNRGFDHAPLVRHLDARRRAGRPAAPSELVSLSATDWAALLSDGTVAPPEGREPEQYARDLFRQVEREYPTQVVAHHWARVTGSRALVDVVERNADLDLGRVRLDAAIADGTLHLPTDDDEARAATELRLVQRLFVLAPRGRRAESIEALYRAGYRSAHDVVERGPWVLEQRIGTALDRTTLAQVFAKAQRKSAVASALVLRHHPALEARMQTHFVGTTTANLETLFGPMSYCACTHCRSVLGPAAYLADLLAFVRQIPAGDQTLLDVLVDRKHRGDVVHLQLDCANTHTPLPYIDLVNERLEAVLAGDRDGAAEHQTTWEADALRVHPEYLDRSVYEALRDEAVHPLTLPFDLFHTEIRAYLDRLDATWLDVLEALAPQGEHRGSAIGAERLGLSPAQLRIIVGEHEASLEAMWGVTSLGDLRSVPRLLEAAGIDLAGLEALLATRWFQTPAVAFAEPVRLRIEQVRPCELEGATIEGLPTPSAWLWDRAHRLLRLAQGSGFGVGEVDLGIRSFGNALDRDVIEAMGELERLRSRLGAIPRDEMLSWWAPMGTHPTTDGARSLYDRVFLSGTDGSATISMFGLDQEREELRFPGVDLDPHFDAVAAALRLSRTSLRGLLDAMPDAPTVLTLDGLSRLHRHVSLARAAGLSPVELLRWTAVLGHDPFASPVETRAFLERRGHALALGLSLDAAELVMGRPGASLSPAEPALERWWVELVVAVQAADLAPVSPEQTALDGLRFELASLLPADAVELVLASLTGELALDTEALADVLQVWLAEWLAEDVLGKVIEMTTDPELTPSDVMSTLAAELGYAGRRARRRRAAVEGLRVAVGLETDEARILAETTMVPTGGSLLDSLTADALLTLNVDLERLDADGLLPAEADAAAEALDGLRRFHRGARLALDLRLDASTLSWLAEHGPLLGWLVPSGLPSEGEVVGAAAMDPMLDLASLLRRAENGTQVLEWLDVARSAADPTARLSNKLVIRIGEVLGWSREAVLPFADRLRPRYVDLLDFSLFARIDAAVALAARTDLDPAKLTAWVTAGPSADTAREVRELVAARIDPGQRAAELGPVRDEIRERQRDALVARVVALEPALRAPSALHGALLIDPQMSACRMASRVQQAIAAVQLLIQRVQLGLEPTLGIPRDAERIWTWMSSYRVWEANRKVFLWPENWLDPKLRLDRTPLFDDATSNIMGTNVDHEQGEAAVLGYLDGLRDIARLETAGVGWDAQTRSLHVFGRRKTADRAWFHRRHEDGRWTPWEAVPIQVPAREAMPLVNRGQVMLVWPTIEESADGSEGKYTEVRLSWATCRAGQWSEPRDCGGAGLRIPPNKLTARKPQDLTLEAVQRASKLEVVPFVNFGDDHSTHGSFQLRNGGDEFVAVAEESLTYDSQDLDLDLLFLAPTNVDFFWQSYRHDDVGFPRPLRLPVRSPGGTWGWSPTILGSPFAFEVIAPHQQWLADGEDWIPGWQADQPFVFETSANTLVAWPHRTFEHMLGTTRRYSFEVFQHPFARRLDEHVASAGVEGMYRPDADGPGAGLRRQRLLASLPYLSNATQLVGDLPQLTFDFSEGGAYSEYNWELFLHLPLLIASRLSAAGRHADAKRWLEYIFDPLHPEQDPGTPDFAAAYWMTKPLWQAGRTGSIEDDLELLSGDDLDQDQLERRADLVAAIQRWREHPFEPHVIARLRPGAYQRHVVMRYLDVLIAWGDSLFGRGTTESIDEASQLYLLAAEILGPRPLSLPERSAPVRSFAELAQTQDEFSNFFVMVENIVPLDDDAGSLPIDDFALDDGDRGIQPPGLGKAVAPAPQWIQAHVVQVERIKVPYFCVPHNERLDTYWDTVEDRLFKIRHCLDLRGGRRIPDLFAPPIDPGLLVEAVARGVDLAAAIDDLYAPVPHYRFAVALRRSKELVAMVRELGRGLLSAIERRDGEEIAAIQAEQEHLVLQAVEQVRRKQIEEIERQITAIESSRAVVVARRQYLQGLIDENRSEPELAQIEQMKLSGFRERMAALNRQNASIIAAAPSFNAQAVVQVPGLPPANFITTIGYGSSNMSALLGAWAEADASGARDSERAASLAGIEASYTRRAQQWTHERDQADLELERIDTELQTAKVRREVAQRELVVHQRQASNNAETRAFLRSKYSRTELYEWMVDATMQTHRQAFDLALLLARKAERAYRFELADDSAMFIASDYWESTRRGLLAGERLALDLERMETAYLEEDRREHELVKHVALSQIDPMALLQLRYGGACEFEVAEELFAMDHPDHYLRRLRGVSVTASTQAGPFTGVNATVTLQRSELRPAPTGWETARVVDFSAGTESIALSSGVGDSGTFGSDPADPRRRPFEGKGAISKWRVQLPALPQYDYRSIDDLILELRYTARSGGEGYAQSMINETLPARLATRPRTAGSGWARSWSVPATFPEAWADFVIGAIASLRLELRSEHYPHPLQDGSRKLRRVHLVVEGLEHADATVVVSMAAQPTGPGGAAPAVVEGELSLLSSGPVARTHAGSVELDAGAVGTLTLSDLDASATNVHLIVEYGFGNA